MKYEEFKPSKTFSKLSSFVMEKNEIDSILKMASAQFAPEAKISMKTQMAALGISTKK